jgi:2-(1,2-epoxy-1,2-dihydrophenyl)acetyl-CoA isomerase
MTSPLQCSYAEHIATLVLSRPAHGNTIDVSLARALQSAAERCEEDDDIRCVVVTGRGKLFCGGGDISAFDAAGTDVSAFLHELAGTLHDAIGRFMRMRKPLITLVNGPAAGAGLSLSLIGDFVFAARGAHFTAAYTALGLSPDGGMSWLLPRMIGMRKAQDILLSNRRVSSEEAEAIGLITRAVDSEHLERTGSELAARLVNEPVEALSATRRLLLESYKNDLEEQLDREKRSIAALGGSEVARARIAAFISRQSSRKD